MPKIIVLPHAEYAPGGRIIDTQKKTTLCDALLAFQNELFRPETLFDERLFAMKTTSILALRTVPVVLAGLLAACATPTKGTASDEAEHNAHHPDKSTSVVPPQSMPARPGAGNQMGMMRSMDMKSMCDMHRNMMGSTSPAERDAMMEQRMPSMSPEMRRQHMEMMDAKCR